MTDAEHKSEFLFTKDAPYLGLMSKLWVIYCENFFKKLTMLTAPHCICVVCVAIRWLWYLFIDLWSDLFILEMESLIITQFSPKYSQQTPNRLVSQILAPLAACCEQAGKLWQLCKVFERKTQYFLIHAPFTRIVVFWHSGNLPPMIS